MRESYCTTAQFAGAGYVKHCGPTAMTNLVLSLRPELAWHKKEVFCEVAGIGRRMLAYLNLSAGKHFGGTSDGLALFYIRQVLRRFDCANARVRFAGAATGARLRKALAEGEIVYLEMHFHPKYHNHHLLIYAYDWQGYRAADGWLSQPVYLSERDLRGAFFIAIAH